MGKSEVQDHPGLRSKAKDEHARHQTLSRSVNKFSLVLLSFSSEATQNSLMKLIYQPLLNKRESQAWLLMPAVLALEAGGSLLEGG